MGALTAFVTGADHGLGYALTEALLGRGWHVVAGRYAPQESRLAALASAHDERLTLVDLDVGDLRSVRMAAEATLDRRPVIDLLINNAATLGNTGLEQRISDGLPYDTIAETISVNALGPFRMVESLLPGLERSQMRRLCFVSSEAGCIARSHRRSWYGYSMSKSALNMGVSILFNDLRPAGYTFRLYHPGWMRTFMKGVEDMNAELSPAQAADAALACFLDAEVDEDRLVMRDHTGAEWPW